MAGAHITIFGRKQGLLDEARNEILAARHVESQIINAVAGDMGIASNVRVYIALPIRFILLTIEIGSFDPRFPASTSRRAILRRRRHAYRMRLFGRP